MSKKPFYREYFTYLTFGTDHQSILTHLTNLNFPANKRYLQAIENLMRNTYLIIFLQKRPYFFQSVNLFCYKNILQANYLSSK